MTDGKERFQLVLTTAGSREQAESIARELVERKLAACVNVIPGMTSFYRWRGELQREGEVLLVVKSRRGLFDRLAARVRELHSYQVPEIIALPVIVGDEDYLRWLSEATQAD